MQKPAHIVFTAITAAAVAASPWLGKVGQAVGDVFRSAAHVFIVTSAQAVANDGSFVIACQVAPKAQFVAWPGPHVEVLVSGAAAS